MPTTRAVRGLAKVSVDDLNRELRRRQKVASQFEAKRTRLLGALETAPTLVRQL